MLDGSLKRIFSSTKQFVKSGVLIPVDGRPQSSVDFPSFQFQSRVSFDYWHATMYRRAYRAQNLVEVSSKCIYRVKDPGREIVEVAEYVVFIFPFSKAGKLIRCHGLS